MLCSRAALGIVSYGIAFGIQALSGNIFFNMFLFSIVGIPSKAIAMWLQNRSVLLKILNLNTHYLLYSLAV